MCITPGPPERRPARFVLTDTGHTGMKHAIFVYGSLKRGGSNHHLMSGQHYIGNTRTQPSYRLYSLGDYPAMIESPLNGQSIEGEVWEVDAPCLQQLDRLEGLAEGMYQRVPIRLQPPFDHTDTQGYLYLLDIQGRPDCGPCWPT